MHACAVITLLYNAGTEMRTLGCAAARHGMISSLLFTILNAFPNVNYDVIRKR